MFDQSAIQELTLAEATNASNNALQHALTGGKSIAALHEDFNVQNLESYLPQRNRARNKFVTPYVSDFAGYVNQHRELGCTIYVNAEEMKADAVLNQGTPQEPGHGDNTAAAVLRKTAAYAALRNLTSRHRSQKELAEWIEEWREYIKAQDKDLFEINIGHVVSGIRSVSIEQINNSTSSVEALSAERSEMESVSAKAKGENATIPAFLVLTTCPYKELQERTFYVRVSILTSERAPTFALAILGQEIHEEEMADEFANVVRVSFEDYGSEDAPQVLLGSFAVRG